VVGSGITGIGVGAFDACVSLTGIYFLGKAPSAGACLCSIEVPPMPCATNYLNAPIWQSSPTQPEPSPVLQPCSR
jgi:hypothetical protein